MPELMRVDRDGVTWWHGFGLKNGSPVEYRMQIDDAEIATWECAKFRARHRDIEWIEPNDQRLLNVG